MSFELILKILPWVVLLVQPLFAWALWSMRREFVRREDLGDVTRRLTAVEAKLDNMPCNESWVQMQVNIEELRGQNTAVLAKLEGNSDLLKRFEHQIHLLLEHQLRRDA